MFVLNYQRLVNSRHLLDKLSKKVRERIVLLNATGIDLPSINGLITVDSRDILNSYFVNGGTSLLVGRISSPYHQSLIKKQLNGAKFVEVE
jgi:hypothetical protein